MTIRMLAATSFIGIIVVVGLFAWFSLFDLGLL